MNKKQKCTQSKAKHTLNEYIGTALCCSLHWTHSSWTVIVRYSFDLFITKKQTKIVLRDTAFEKKYTYRFLHLVNIRRNSDNWKVVYSLTQGNSSVFALSIQSFSSLLFICLYYWWRYIHHFVSSDFLRIALYFFFKTWDSFNQR